MDFVITVCDQAAGDVCPVSPGHPASAHWRFLDPAAMEGPDESERTAFKRVFQQIRCRVEALVEVPLDELDAAAIRAAVRRVSDIDVTAIGSSGMLTRG